MNCARALFLTKSLSSSKNLIWLTIKTRQQQKHKKSTANKEIKINRNDRKLDKYCLSVVFSVCLFAYSFVCILVLSSLCLCVCLFVLCLTSLFACFYFRCPSHILLVCLSVCLPDWLPVYLSACLVSVCLLNVCLPSCLVSVCLPLPPNSDSYIKPTSFCYAIASPTSSESVMNGFASTVVGGRSPGPAPGTPLAALIHGVRSTRTNPLYCSLKKVRNNKAGGRQTRASCKVSSCFLGS